MSKKPQSYEEELDAIMNALAESVAEASDEEILEEMRLQGEDPTEAAGRVRNVLLDTVKMYKQKRLRDAQEQYDSHIAVMRNKTYRLPASPMERRRFLDLTLSKQPAVRSALTAQYRDLTSLTDNDVESYLKQLQELGLLHELSDSGEQNK